MQHIAFIADGNRRWAKARFLPKIVGHRRGFNKMIEIADYCLTLKIPLVSFFAFSTENWQREQAEIDDIFQIIEENISKQTKHFVAQGVRVVFWGDLSRFPESFQKAALDCVAQTKNLTKMTLALCVNYGGKADIVQAVAKIKGQVTAESISRHLYSAAYPDPDIVVRTSGEKRLSNFMLWQMAYSELFFLDKYWPNIGAKDIDKIIREFNKRHRRNGK